MIYVIQDMVGLGLTMSKNKKVFNPGDEMVFECTLYNLMEKVWCNKLMDVGTWKIIRKRLEFKN
jgi:hypothetical protein